MSEHGPTKKIAADGHEYHVSATANATVAPTNEATLKDATDLAGLSSEQAEFVTLIDYEWHKSGTINVEAFNTEYSYTEDQFNNLFNAPEVLAKLTTRGILVHQIMPSLVPEASRSRVKLTPIQLRVANSYMDLMDTRSTKKKLADLGVTTQQFQAWLRNDDFRDYLKARAEALGGDNLHEAWLTLISKVQSGDMKATELYFEITGTYVKQTNATVGGTLPDFQNLIVRIIEIILDEVDDAQVAARIADRMKALVTGAQVAGVLEVPTIHQPEIAESRVITPKVQELINKGAGVNT